MAEPAGVVYVVLGRASSGGRITPAACGSLAEGRSVHYVARRLGHSPALTLSTYGHLFAEYEHADRIDAAAEIEQARAAHAAPIAPAPSSRTRSVHKSAAAAVPRARRSTTRNSRFAALSSPMDASREKADPQTAHVDALIDALLGQRG